MLGSKKMLYIYWSVDMWWTFYLSWRSSWRINRLVLCMSVCLC